MLATVGGQPYTELPPDLFIPPDALEVLLESFTGPLDLLLYLIRSQHIDILDIPMTLMTKQYLHYIELLEAKRMELAADYLVMAALLIEIKSKMLLPEPVNPHVEIEEDPRMQLVRRLQLYEQFKQAALELDSLPRLERDLFPTVVNCAHLERIKLHPDVELIAVVSALTTVLQRQTHYNHHQITREGLSVRERMTLLLQRLRSEQRFEFTHLLQRYEGRMGVVITLLAILELAKQSLLVVTQVAAYSPIYVQANYHG